MPDTIKPMDFVTHDLPVKKLEIAAKSQSQEQLKKACQDFESIFVNYMLKQMRQTVNKSGLVGSSQAEELYTSMLDNEVAKSVSQSRGIGLASMIYKQMSTIVDDGATKK